MSGRSIIVTEGVFGGRFVLTFEPRSIAWPSLEFRTHAEALACARQRHAFHGWPIIDRTQENAG